MTNFNLQHTFMDLPAKEIMGLDPNSTRQIVFRITGIVNLFDVPKQDAGLRNSFKTYLDFVINNKNAFEQLNRDDLRLLKEIKKPSLQRIILSSDNFINTLSEDELSRYGKCNDLESRVCCAESKIFAKKVPYEVLESLINDEPDVVSALVNNENAILRLSRETIEKIAKRDEPIIRRSLISNKKVPEKLSEDILYGFLVDPEPLVKIAALRNPEFTNLIDQEYLKKLLKVETDWRVKECIKMQILSNNVIQNERRLLRT